MNAVTDWLLNLPRFFGDMVGWLTTDLDIFGLKVSPLALFGSAFGTFIVILIGLKIKNLIV